MFWVYSLLFASGAEIVIPTCPAFVPNPSQWEHITSITSNGGMNKFLLLLPIYKDIRKIVNHCLPGNTYNSRFYGRRMPIMGLNIIYIMFQEVTKILNACNLIIQDRSYATVLQVVLNTWHWELEKLQCFNRHKQVGIANLVTISKDERIFTSVNF